MTAAEKLRTMANLNIMTIGDHVQFTCGHDWLEKTRATVQGEPIYKDVIHNKPIPFPDSVNCQNGQISAVTLGGSIPDTVIICKHTLRKPRLLEAGYRDRLDYIFDNSLSAIIAHEILHTVLLGKRTRSQREYLIIWISGHLC